MNTDNQQLTCDFFYPSEKTQTVNDNRKWYVIYTCSRTEKIVYQELAKRGYESFLPIVKTLRVWKNRQKKLVDKILFPGYVFVNTHESELYNIKQMSKVVTFIHCGGKPSSIPLVDIECIKKMLKLNRDLSIENTFYKGEKVRIVSGPLAGFEGILIKQKGRNRFGIQLMEINQIVLIDVCCSMLEKIA